MRQNSNQGRTERVRAFSSVEEVVTSGYCMGCGLCAGNLSGGKIHMAQDDLGRPRPRLSTPLDDAEIAKILEVCPGVNVMSDAPTGGDVDPVWGHVRNICLGHATDPVTRFKAATGGVMTALSAYLLRSGRAKAVLHVRPDPDRPLMSLPQISRTEGEVLSGCSSRYGPVSPLTAIHDLLAAGEPFAVALKPCDVAGIRNLQRHDSRARELVVFASAMFCGTTPDLTPNIAFLERNGLSETDLESYSWRGNGCPGPTRATVRDGRTFDATYNELWLDQPFKAQFRCRMCPDAVGEVADIATGDTWPGGEPQGEDDGCNAIVCHTQTGVAILREAEAAGLIRTEPYDLAQLNAAQPHHIRLKQELYSRLAANREWGKAEPRFEGMRLKRLDAQLSDADRTRIRSATISRLRSGAASEVFEMPDETSE